MIPKSALSRGGSKPTVHGTHRKQNVICSSVFAGLTSSQSDQHTETDTLYISKNRPHSSLSMVDVIRSSSYITFAVPRTRTALGDRSFAVAGPRVEQFTGYYKTDHQLRTV